MRWTTLASVLAAFASSQAAAQTVPRLTVLEASISADTIGIGDGFDVTLRIELAPGSVAFLPDSLYGSGFEPLGSVEWTRSAENEITATYPLIAFQVGTVEVPEFEVFAASLAEGVAAGVASSGDVVGDFGRFVDNVSALPSARLRSVPPMSIWVASVLIVEDVAVGFRPRPPADVWGANRNAIAMALGFGSLILLFWVASGATREWLNRRAMAARALDARRQALAELDELLASGLHHEGRVREFFRRSSDIVRRYVEHLEDRWGPAWTSTELMTDLRDAPVAPVTEDLEGEMASAETVKFGGDRPDVERADEHVRTVRQWIEDQPLPGETPETPPAGAVATKRGLPDTDRPS
jgi:hypothetical protein